MHLPGFFRLGWIVQLLVGVALFSVSFLIENLVLKSFFAAPLIALTLAAALELGKAAAIVWHRYLSLSTGGGYPWATRIFSMLFRFGLLGLSVVCSLLYFGVQLDRPNLEAVRATELAAVDKELQERLGRLDAEQKNRAEIDEARRRTQCRPASSSPRARPRAPGAIRTPAARTRAATSGTRRPSRSTACSSP